MQTAAHKENRRKPARLTLNNNRNRKSRLSVGLFLGLAWLALAGAQAATVSNPRCEYLVNPEGIDATAPRLSWEMVSAERGARQTAWRVLVASSPGELANDHGDFWDSGRVTSDRDNQIYYAGKALESRMDCYWKVRIWDQAGKPSPWSEPAHWSMGLLNASEWKAVWIGCDQPGLAKRHLVINKATYRVDGSAENQDITARIANLVKDESLAVAARDKFVGASPGAKITLHLDCDFNGEHVARDIANGARLTLQQAPAEPRYLRKAFAIAKPVRRARLYVTALGLYQMRLNGAPVGDHVLAPEWTDYFKRVQYQTYDVTTALRRGDNVLGAILGNGWYCGYWQLWKPMLGTIYGTEPWLKAQLEIDYADGSTKVIVSDASWGGTTDGPIRLSGIYEGETYDARMEMPGWDRAGFDDHGWENATVGEPKAGQLVAQRSEPIRVTQEIPGARLTEPKPGVYVIDFGQNVAGWCRMALHEKPGTTVTLKLNEVLNPDGTVYMDNLHAGHLSEGDRQVLRYTCRGGGETYEPLFTYLGFRYVEVSGLTCKPVPGDFTARVFHTSMRKVGSFQCSSPLVNALQSNIQWSQRANMMGIPTDCCQRDERCGYTGDMNFFMPTAIYNFDVAAFFNKWLVDVCEDAQQPDGHFTDHAPTFGPGNGYNVGWGDAGIICPWRMWQAYGDTQIIRDHYEAMKRFMAFVGTRGKDGLYTKPVGDGDWLNLGGGASAEVIGTTYAAYDYRLMAEMAHAIGRDRDAAGYADEADKISTAFARDCIDGEGRIKDSSQTGYALAFTMHLVPEEARTRVAGQFASEIDRFHGYLATGFIGTPRLLPGLHLAGRDDLACRLLLNEDYPSWLYEVKNGATTTWERWNGLTPDHRFPSSGMNSFNHYAFGSVGEYLMGEVAGIQADAPGYKRLTIAPVIEPGLSWASATYDSIEGRIVSEWALGHEGLDLKVTIPPNTTGTIRIPANNAKAVSEGGILAGSAKGLKFLKFADGAATYKAEPGTYRFRVDAGPP